MPCTQTTQNMETNSQTKTEQMRDSSVKKESSFQNHSQLDMINTSQQTHKA